MKKLLISAVILVSSLSLSACTAKTPEANETKQTPASSQATPEVVTPVNEKNMEESNKPGQVSAPAGQADLLAEYSKAVIHTNYGDIEVKLYSQDSPVTVNNFLNLAQAGFYDDTKFHRVIKDFMIQGGDPLSRGSDISRYGTGGPGYRFADEINSHLLVKGSLAMANAGPNTNGSQFFIVTAEATPWLDGLHTNFGEVVSGMEVVEKIGTAATGANDRPLQDVVVSSVELLP